MAGELAQNVALDAVVDGDDVVFGAVALAVAFVPNPGRFVPGKTLAGGHHRHQIHAEEARPGFGLALERFDIEAAGRLVGNHGVRHAFFANERGERAGVDAGEPDDAAVLQPGIEMFRGAIVRRLGDGGMQHHPARARRRRQIHGLDIVVVDADIADMGEGEGDDLARIGRIGEDLLVAGHRGVEADFAHRLSGGAEADAFEHRAVGEHEQRRRLGILPFQGSLWRASLRLCRHRQGPKCSAQPPAPGGAHLREAIAVLRDDINNAIKEAMKAGQARRVSTLRMVNAAILARETSGAERLKLSDPEILDVMGKMIKQRQESLDIYEKAGRAELAAQEREEIGIISAYLPKRMSDIEAASAISSLIKELEAATLKDMGRTMTALKERFAGRMDTAKASAIVKKLLGGG